MMTGEVAEYIGNKLGKFIGSDRAEAQFKWGTKIPIRVSIGIHKSLTRALFMCLMGGDQEIMVMFAYYRLLNFCYKCGMFGHIMRDCERHLENSDRKRIEELPYGSWLLESREELSQISQAAHFLQTQHTKATIGLSVNWRFTGVYGETNVAKKKGVVAKILRVSLSLLWWNRVMFTKPDKEIKKLEECFIPLQSGCVNSMAHEEMGRHQQHIKELRGQEMLHWQLSIIQPRVTTEMNQVLAEPFTITEVKQATFEALSHLMQVVEQQGQLTGVAAAEQVPRVSHLLFVDNTLVFCEANMTQLERIWRVLGRYKNTSSQVINF
ncbi:UNVERIFIED_CONTAM: hypothetical protein Scaly_2232700 [Sesamum calycinum]|uniref:CCHC-type domain-containing protein n=1 Tax=Sesamum calycinum TaxID=2727403 RepID=A0AAW2MCX9_9LAMI